jgi:hypothetical protein
LVARACLRILRSENALPLTHPALVDAAKGAMS